MASAILDIPNRYLSVAPVIVTSPTTRCGTTLVQRLLSAAGNAFIYGEEVGNQFRTLTALFGAQVAYCQANGQGMDDDFFAALTGRLQSWRPGLTPPPKVLLQAWTETYYQLPVALAQFGASIGRPIWGFKWPGLTADTMRAYLTLMPQAKVVYVTRNVVDALKSAKARRFANNPGDAATFCGEWSRNMAGLAPFRQDPRIHVLRYETLAADGPNALAALCAFTGAAEISPLELQTKVNTFAGAPEDGHSPTQYIDPMALTDEDWAAVRAHAGDQLALYEAEAADGHEI